MTIFFGLRRPIVGVSILVVAILCVVDDVKCTEELRVTSPSDLAASFSYNGKPGVIKETPALFGIPSYQTALAGSLYLSVPIDGCTPINTTAMGVNPNILDTKLIFLDRGGCTFTTKVRNAGFAGFQSAIVGDTSNEPNIPYMADDGTTPAVTTPSVLIGYNDANTLRSYLQGPNGRSVVVSIEYSLPNPDNRVEWDLWTTSVDPLSAGFKHTFQKPVKVLGASALFTPHFYTISGQGIHCTDPSATCGNQCTNEARYCAVDPERNTTYGLTGRDVIQENVRQWCLWNVTLDLGLPQYKWFDYVIAFDRACSGFCPAPADPSVNPECATGFSSQCSYIQMNALGLPVTLVEKCVTNSGGTDTRSGANSILEQQITDLSQSAIFFIPTLTINLQPYRGSLTCAVPTDLTNCGPLGGICRGFQSPPSACLTSAGCDVGEIRDACGVCGGDGAVDACGVCGSQVSPSFNSSCRGCDGVANSKAVNDACGVCQGPGTRLGSCLSAGSLAAIFIFTILIAIAVGVGIWWYLKRQSRVMRDDIDSLLKQYLPLEGGTNAKQNSDHARLVDEPNDI